MTNYRAIAERTAQFIMVDLRSRKSLDTILAVKQPADLGTAWATPETQAAIEARIADFVEAAVKGVASGTEIVTRDRMRRQSNMNSDAALTGLADDIAREIEEHGAIGHDLGGYEETVNATREIADRLVERFGRAW